MVRWLLLLSLTGCDKGPIREHHITYEMSGLSSNGPLTYRAEVDLDAATLQSSIGTKRTNRLLDAATTKGLRDLAGCARDEKKGPDHNVSDLYERLVLAGDVTKEIAQSGPMTAPCSSKLAEWLETLAGWHE